MHINQAVKNNPKKFPKGYILEVQSTERQELIKNFDRFETLKHSISTKAFTEKGLYMLATILKSDRAIDATIEIVETFAKMRELARNITTISSMEPEVVEPEVVESVGGLINDLFLSHLPTASSETSFEFNVGIMKGKKTIKSESSNVVQNLQNQINKLEQTIEKMNKQFEKFG
jgi:hypothetical protein